MKKKKLKHLSLNKFKIAQINNISAHRGGREIAGAGDSGGQCASDNGCDTTGGEEMTDKVGTCKSDQILMCPSEDFIICGG